MSRRFADKKCHPELALVSIIHPFILVASNAMPRVTRLSYTSCDSECESLWYHEWLHSCNTGCTRYTHAILNKAVSLFVRAWATQITTQSQGKISLKWPRGPTTIRPPQLLWALCGMGGTVWDGKHCGRHCIVLAALERMLMSAMWLQRQDDVIDLTGRGGGKLSTTTK